MYVASTVYEYVVQYLKRFINTINNFIKDIVTTQIMLNN